MLSEPVTPVPDRLAAVSTASAPATPETQTRFARRAARAAPTTNDLSPAEAHVAAVPPAAELGISSLEAPPEVVPPPLGHVYGVRNVNARVELRVYRSTRLLVEGPDKRVYLNRTLRRGDIYRAPNLVGLTLTTPDGGAVEVILDGASMGFAGRGSTTTEAISLDPQAIVDRRGAARSG
ncbi:MAG: hypothetical protein ACT4OG_10345, partial [Alphaproteobacteria bacterium]